MFSSALPTTVTQNTLRWKYPFKKKKKSKNKITFECLNVGFFGGVSKIIWHGEAYLDFNLMMNAQGAKHQCDAF